MTAENEIVVELLEDARKFSERHSTRDSLVRVLQVFKKNHSPKLWEIYEKTEEYLPSALGIVMAMEKGGFIEPENGFLKLTGKGKNLVDLVVPKAVDYRTMEDFRFGVKMPAELKRIEGEIRRISQELIMKDEFDQAPITADSVVLKAYHMISRGDIAGKSVVLLGDDDLMSIVLGLTSLPKEILVIDIDKDVAGIVEKYSKKLGIKVPMRAVVHDFRKPIPKNIRGKFDTFVTQPPDTVLGMLLFVSRGVELLKDEPGMVGYAGFTKTGCPQLGILDFWEKIVGMKLVISEVIPKFTVYPGIRTEIKEVEVPEFIDYPPKQFWYISDLIRLKTTKRSKSMFEGKTFEGDISDYRRDVLKYR
ncbi:hypothetical protein A3K63_05490 [Candidatus Micrarchaeota archaeon RBG_16_49_10]|nr:MAG: hypothetical protein A3K63_05490 [Candidatus Micrarchaeota archaeon RBG_16_49_10]